VTVIVCDHVSVIHRIQLVQNWHSVTCIRILGGFEALNPFEFMSYAVHYLGLAVIQVPLILWVKIV
jgi:hypothetical protein